MRPNPQFSPDLVTFTEEILNGKLYIFCNVKFMPWWKLTLHATMAPAKKFRAYELSFLVCFIVFLFFERMWCYFE